MHLSRKQLGPVWANMKCAALAVSAIALLVLWGGAVNKAGIVLTAILWLCFWKKIRRAVPCIGRGDAGHIAVGVALSVVSGIHFCWRHLDSMELTGSSVTTSFIVVLAAIGTVAAIPFAIAFTKYLFDVCHSDAAGEGRMSPQWSWSGVLLAAVGIAAMVAMSFSHDIWVDEAFSLNLVRHSYAEVVGLTAVDVHPPLYYIILKAVVDATHTVFPTLPTTFVAKLVSVVPYLILVCVMATRVRRDYGVYVASLAAVCVVGMSHQPEYGIEIRMYGWAMCFVTLAYLQVRDAMAGRGLRPWALLVVFSLCAAYTHYYACVAAGMLYLCLLVWLWMKDRGRIWQWAVAAVLTAVGYLPWLMVLLRQLRTVSGSYWIDDITLGTLWSYLIFVFACPMLLLVVIAMLMAVVRKRQWNIDEAFALVGVAVPVGVIVVGVVVSLLMRPVFIERYALPALCCLWIGLLILAEKTGRVAIRGVMGVTMGLVCAANIAGFTYNETKYLIAAKRTMAFVEAHKEVVYVGNATHPTATMATLSGCDCMYYGKKEVGKLTTVVYGNVTGIDDAQGIVDKLRAGHIVYALIDEKEEGVVPIADILCGTPLRPTLIDTLRVSNRDVKVYLIDRP